MLASRAFRELPTHLPRPPLRAFHASVPALKKKAKVEIEDLFDSGDAPEFLTPASDAKVSSTTQGRFRKRGLTEEKRVDRFHQLLDFVSPRLGKKPAVRTPKIRKSSWDQLVQLATTQEQLEKVVELFPKWKDMGSDFGDKFGDLLTRRCSELSCPILALKVFGNFPRYGVKMSLTSGRQLLHSLHIKYPIDNTIAAASLFGVYSLPPVAEDLSSCSMLIHACLQHNSKDSVQVANALLPRFRGLLEAQPPLVINKRSPELAQDPSPLWLLSSLRQLDQVLYVRNGRKAEEWLREWRTKSSFVTTAPVAKTTTTTTP